MKKIGYFLIFVLFFSLIINLSTFNAEESQNVQTGTAADSINNNFEIDPDTGLPKETEVITDIGNKLSDDEERSEYLRKEWAKMLNNSKFGPYINKTQETMQKADPVWKVLLGVEFTFSWIFILTLILFIIILDFGFDILTGIQARLDFFGEDKIKLTKWGCFLVFLIVISTIRIPYFLSNFIISWISNDLHWIIQILLLAIIIFAIVLFEKFGVLIKEYFVKEKKDRDIESTKKEVKEQRKEIEEEISETRNKVEENTQKIKEDDEEKDINEEAEEDLFGSGQDADE